MIRTECNNLYCLCFFSSSSLELKYVKVCESLWSKIVARQHTNHNHWKTLSLSAIVWCWYLLSYKVAESFVVETKESLVFSRMWFWLTQKFERYCFNVYSFFTLLLLPSTSFNLIFYLYIAQKFNNWFDECGTYCIWIWIFYKEP